MQLTHTEFHQLEAIQADIKSTTGIKPTLKSIVRHLIETKHANLEHAL
jgi:hypothetical protein